MVERKLVVGKLVDRFIWGSGNVCSGGWIPKHQAERQTEKAGREESLAEVALGFRSETDES
jgi:hypothetical protein